MEIEQRKSMASAAVELARQEIRTYGVPDMLLLDISLQKGRWISECVGADPFLVEAGIALMDVKLGQAFREKRVPDHVTMSVAAANSFLATQGANSDEIAKVIGAVEAHHGDVPFNSLEAEVCANADCYRFIHPKGVFLYLTVLGARLGDYGKCLAQAEAKLEEKWRIVSLDVVRNDLGPVYRTFKQYFAMAKE